MSRRRTLLLGNPDAVHGFYRDERRVSGMPGASKKSQRDSETLDINENAIKNELGLLSKAGTMFRAKLIEQFQLVYRIGSMGSAANYLTSQYTLNDIKNKMDEVMMTNAHAQVKLPSLRIKRRNVNILVDGFRRQRNRANIKHQNNDEQPLPRAPQNVNNQVYAPFNEWAYWVLASTKYQIMIQMVIVLHLLTNNLHLEYSLDELPNLASSINSTNSTQEALPGSLVALSVFEHMGSILLLCDILLKWIYDFRGYWRTMLNVIDVIIIPLTSPILMSTIKIISPPTAAEGEKRVITTLDRFIFFTRMLRLLLTLKFALTFEGCRLTLVLIRKTLRRLIKAIYIFLLAMVSFGAFAIIAFDDGSGEIKWFPHDMQLHAASLAFTFQMFTGDHWYDWYKDFTKRTTVSRAVVTIYIITWIIVSDFLLGNMFIGLLTLNFQEIRAKLMEQLEQLKKKKRASLQLDLLNEELRQHSSEMFLQSQLDQQTPTASLERFTSKIEQELSIPVSLPDSKELMAALRETFKPSLAASPSLKPVAEASVESYQTCAAVEKLVGTGAKSSSAITAGPGIIHDNDNGLKPTQLPTGTSSPQKAPVKPSEQQHVPYIIIDQDSKLSVNKSSPALAARRSAVTQVMTGLTLPVAGLTPPATGLAVPKPHKIPPLHAPTKLADIIVTDIRSLPDTLLPSNGVYQERELFLQPQASAVSDLYGNSQQDKNRPAVPIIQLPSGESMFGPAKDFHLAPLPRHQHQQHLKWSSHFLAKSDHSMRTAPPKPKQVETLKSSSQLHGSTTYIDHLSAKQHEGMGTSHNPNAAAGSHFETSLHYDSAGHRQESKPEHCKKMNRQIRSTLRWNRNILLNMETMEQLYAVCMYPEDTLLSYLMLLGDLVENLKERQILIHKLNTVLIDMTDNTDDLEGANGKVFNTDDSWINKIHLKRKTSSYKSIIKQRLTPNTNFMSLIRELIEKGRKQKAAGLEDEHTEVTPQSTEHGSALSQDSGNTRKLPERDVRVQPQRADMGFIAEESTEYDDFILRGQPAS